MAMITPQVISDNLELETIEASLSLLCPICHMDMEISLDIDCNSDIKKIKGETSCCGLVFEILRIGEGYVCFETS
jgi:hypothetical protein